LTADAYHYKHKQSGGLFSGEGCPSSGLSDHAKG
jgi:hypothetical protein